MMASAWLESWTHGSGCICRHCKKPLSVDEALFQRDVYEELLALNNSPTNLRARVTYRGIFTPQFQLDAERVFHDCIQQAIEQGDMWKARKYGRYVLEFERDSEKARRQRKAELDKPLYFMQR